MAKAMRLMEENLKLCDALVCVLDARAPASSYNPNLTRLAGAKPVLYLLNKSDLASSAAGELCARLVRDNKPALLLSASSGNASRLLKSAMESLASEKAKRLAEKGSKKPVRFLITGVPNTGKSTIINVLAGGKKAQVGDKAGVTKTKQWVRCGSFELMDTPGVMPPSLTNQTLARRLAYLGCINDEILSFDEIALALLSDLAQKYPESLQARYGIEGGEPLEMLEKLCLARGFLLKGKEYDFERAERALLDDLRKGRLGKVCFDGADDLKEVGLLSS